MATPREAPWLEIRRVWESTLIGDAELAAQFGFSSKNSIWRRRTSDGWTRDEKAIEAETARRAVAALPAGVADVTPPATSRPHHETQQTQASDPQLGVGVTAKMGVDTSLSGQSRSVVREPAADGAIEDWLATAADAKRRHLVLARRMQSTATRIMNAIDGVLAGPQLGGVGEDVPDDQTPYGLAIIALRAVNADKDTLTSLAKVAFDGADKGVKLERAVLGLDDGAGGDAGAAELPAGIVPAEELVSLGAVSYALLEALSEAGKEAEQRRPKTIDGQSERVK